MWLNVARVVFLSSCILLAPLLRPARKVERGTVPAPGRRQNRDSDRTGSFLQRCGVQATEKVSRNTWSFLLGSTINTSSHFTVYKIFLVI